MRLGLRRIRWCGPLAVLTLLPAAPAVARAQAVVVGVLADDRGTPVAGAQVTFVADAHPDLPSLRDLAAVSAPQVGRSDAAGVFRVPADRPGLLLATTERGLGAVAERCWPGRAVRLQLQPMAEVALADGSPFTLWPARTDASGERRRLPPRAGTAVRLPAGRYELWVVGAAGAGWQEVDLGSGERRILAADGPRWELHAAPGARVHPAGFADLVLLDGSPDPSPDGNGASCTLLGHATRAPLIVQRRDPSDAATWLDARSPGVGRLDAPVLTHDLLRVLVEGAAGPVAAWLIAGARVLAHTQGATAAVALPVPLAAGECWALFVAADRAPVVLRIAELRRQPHVLLVPGTTLRCQLTAPDGGPGTGVAVTFEPSEGAPATARAYANDAGQVDLGPIAGAGVVRIADPRYRGVAVPLAQGEATPLSIELDAGEALRGVIAWPDGTPAAGVAVTLRDPQGLQHPVERTVLSDAAGVFACTGLEPGTALLLFASRQRDGHTFSARAKVAAGDTALSLQLRDEDPQLRPPDGHR